MPNFVKVAKTSEIPPGTGKTVEAGGVPIALFNVGGSFHAVSNTCVHRGGPLGDGDLDGTTVSCPWHAWQYDVCTGKCLTNPMAAVPSYEVQVEGEDVLVGV